ncbi:unnamed protein product [Coffea canephora]|uniref:Protein CHUP1, chloroplastic n=1 Tax=Coffea canephora TaxID=49390 RepID=A0A068V491_COFCA|nr:unnamed protein product [Coffea canephora]
MDSTSTKADVIKPVLLRAGIPLAITVAGFIVARITTRKRSSRLNTSSAENEASSRGEQTAEGCFPDVQSINSSSLSSLDAYHSITDTSNRNSEEELQHQHIFELEEEVLVLRNQIKDVHVREFELEVQYLRYHDMKEQELLLMELQNKLLLEITRVELLDEEISSVEADRKSFESVVVEYLKMLELLEISRSRNRLLQRKVKKLLRRTKEHSRVIKQQHMQIEAKEAEIFRNHQELEAKANIIRRRENEIKELKLAFGQLQMEKDELSRQMELANTAASSKIDADEATMVDYGRVAANPEQLEKEHAAAIKELIYLRWCNACLRHELLRKNLEQEDLQQRKDHRELNFGEISNFGWENEHDHSSWDHGDSCLNLPATGHAHPRSTQQKFIDKFRRWVEGSDKTKQKIEEKKKHNVSHSLLPHGPGYLHNPARKSYSSS